MPLIFTCKTLEGYHIKILAELLHHNIKDASLIIKKQGIFFRSTDSNKTVLIDFVLNANHFKRYKLLKDEIVIGLNMNFFYKALQSVKKSEFVIFSIDDDNENDFIIKSGESSKTMTTVIKSQQIQIIDIGLPEGYSNYIPIPSSDFQKMLKNLAKAGNIITIKIKNSRIKFISDSAGIIKKDVEFGDDDSDSDDDLSNSEDNNADYLEDFDSKQINKIAKIANLSKNFIEVYTIKGQSLLLKTTIGNLGNISIYVKTKHQQNCDSLTCEE